ncbi:branched-chain amino acid ABC transporter permease [Candidatus Poribacteria bacterium]|nr:branched-chain amino acid ABC transporter permease [Candidatus Poribacteria bacterium]
MVKKIVNKSLLALWFGLLVFPFMGIKNALLLSSGIEIIFLFLIFIEKKELLKIDLINIKKINSFIPQKFIISSMAILLTSLPLFINNYFVDVITLAGIYIILALGLNIVVGLAGLLNLGFVAFYAIGAYSYAILSTNFHVSFWILLPIGMILVAVSGVLLGFPALRLKGDYLAIVTLGFGEMIHLVLNNWDKVTKGPNGILNIPSPSTGNFVFNDPRHYYYLILFFVFLTIIAIDRINNSRIGRYWIAIREDEIAAEAMGIDTSKMKLMAFSFGALWAGLAGVLFAAKMRFVSPESFTFSESIIILCMVIIGGMGSILGVILGALILVILPEALRGFDSYRMLALGIGLIIMMIYKPEGILGRLKAKG